MTDAELRSFIESWIPINVKDAQHVKQAKLEAREEFIQLIKARDAAIRIDEDENWLRFVGAAWDAEPVTANDLHKRIKELRRESDLGRHKEGGANGNG